MVSEPPAQSRRRKADHLRIVVEEPVAHTAPTGLGAVRLRHRALPGRDLAAVDLRTELLGRELAAPILVSAMTGGTPEAGALNARLARAAATHGVGMVLGSGRALVHDPALLPTYRTDARPPLLLANLGAAQLDPEQAVRLVELLDADGLTIHLNAVQEAIQPEGSPVFEGVTERIAEVVDRLAPLPVVVKEVGFGMDGADVAELAAIGVAAVDVAGAGGTNWALVEGHRDPRAAAVAAAFAAWGVPTADALREARDAAPDLPVLASGGVRDGVDVVRCLALGARAAGLARPLLVAAHEDRADEAVELLVRQVRIATWATGAAASAALGPQHLRGPTP